MPEQSKRSDVRKKKKTKIAELTLLSMLFFLYENNLYAPVIVPICKSEIVIVIVCDSAIIPSLSKSNSFNSTKLLKKPMALTTNVIIIYLDLLLLSKSLILTINPLR